MPTWPPPSPLPVQGNGSYECRSFQERISLPCRLHAGRPSSGTEGSCGDRTMLHVRQALPLGRLYPLPQSSPKPSSPHAFRMGTPLEFHLPCPEGPPGILGRRWVGKVRSKGKSMSKNEVRTIRWTHGVCPASRR